MVDLDLVVGIAGLVTAAVAILVAFLLHLAPGWIERRREWAGDVLRPEFVAQHNPVEPAAPALLRFKLGNLVGRTIPIQLAIADDVSWLAPRGGMVDGFRPLSEVCDRAEVTVRPAKPHPMIFDLAPHDRAEVEVRLWPKATGWPGGRWKVAVEVSFSATGFRPVPYDLGPFIVEVRPASPPRSS
jgi:hypothetical protein